MVKSSRSGTGNRFINKTLLALQTAILFFFISQPTPGQQPGGATGGIDRTLAGFADTPWQSTYQEVFDRMKALATSNAATEDVVILQADRNRTILVKRNDILYRYNFYRTPLNVLRLTEHDLTEEDYDTREARLFHVKVTPSFLEAVRVNQKLQDSYGPRTKTTVDKTNFGADVWDLAAGFIFQWYEPYRGTAYTRTIDYLSKELSTQIMEEYADYFDSREKTLLQDLIVR